MSKAAEISAIIDRSKIAVPQVFAVGCFAKRVTFHSQQHRALNLIWALFETGALNGKSKVAVVGGGLAGMTAAIAADCKGCSVTIYEESSLLMLMQNGNVTRHIHPNIYDWPQAGSAERSTSLPFLNWRAAVAKDVRERILRDWDRLSTRITIVTNQRIDSVFLIGTDLHISSRSPYLLEKFDCVLIATGFGAEREIAGIDFQSYWSSDSLHQSPVKGVNRRIHYLVTGCGDGGLIDVQRLLIDQYDHGQFTEQFINLPEVKALENEIIIIEAEIKSEFFKGSNQDIDAFIYSKYQTLKIPNSLGVWVQNRLRKNIKVTLNSGSTSWTSIKATPLNRFITYLLSSCRVIDYISGIIIETKKDGNQYTVTFNDRDSIQQESFDKILVRHGPVSNVLSILPSKTTIPNIFVEDPTNEKLWSDGFYPTLNSSTKMSLKVKEKVVEFIDEHTDVDGILSVGVKTNANGKYIEVVLEEGNPSYTASAFPPDIDGVPVVVTSETSPITPQFSTIFPNESFNSRLELGSPVATVIGTEKISFKTTLWGTIGCFVKLPNGRIGILSTNHTIGRDGLAKSTDRLITRGRKGTVKVIGNPYSVKHSNEEIHRLEFDGALGMLQMGQSTSSSIDFFGKPLRPERIGEADFEDTVYKMGAGTGLTQSKITSPLCSIRVQYGSNVVSFSNVMEIRNPDRKFSAKGDSGSLVFKEDGTAIGIIFAASDKYSYAFKLGPALEALNCRLFGR